MNASVNIKATERMNFTLAVKKYKEVYIMLIPIVLYYVIFHYTPMYGLIIAFKNYRPALGIMDSAWAGLKHFEDFFGSFYFWRLLKNTLSINIFNILFGFPAPIIFALLLNEIQSSKFKRTIQSITYLPHFISITAICSMIIDFFAVDGPVNAIVELLGGNAISFFNTAEWFQPIYIMTNIWGDFGWGSIIYLSALTAISPELYEAAELDGANRWQKMWHITFMGILPTVTIMLIMRVGHMMSLGSQKILLLYNPNIYETADVISTFVYRKGLVGAEYSYTAAVDMFSSVINFILLISVNAFSRKVNETSLW